MYTLLFNFTRDIILFSIYSLHTYDIVFVCTRISDLNMNNIAIRFESENKLLTKASCENLFIGVLQQLNILYMYRHPNYERYNQN